MKVLHVLYNYYPDLTGSTIRSEGVLKGQLNSGIEPVVITSPFQGGGAGKGVEIIDGIKIYRSKYAIKNDFDISENLGPLSRRIRKFFIIFKFAKYINTIAKQENVSLIHAHSIFFCALASFYASKKQKIPFIYEFRSVWEERMRAKGGGQILLAKIITLLETFSLKIASRIVTINNGLKDEVLKRGVNVDSIFVVPNAVDNSIIQLGSVMDYPISIRRFGYVGNFSEIEGLSLLVDAFIKAFPLEEFPDVTLSFYGRGPYKKQLLEHVENVSDRRVSVFGEFTRDNVVNIYSELDCVVIPRLDLPICQKVTPLKPLEAMAFKRLVIGSDVGGIQEVVSSNDNCLLFRAGDVDSFVKVFHESQSEKIYVKIKNGYNYVCNERNWDSVAKKYIEAYSGIGL